MSVKKGAGTRDASVFGSVVAWMRALGVPVAIALFTIGFQLNIRGMSLESRAYPQLVMVFLSVAVVVTAFEGVKERLTAARAGVPEPAPDRAQWLPVVATMAATAVYVLVMIDGLGFYAATVVYLAVLARLLGLRTWAAVIFALGLTMACYLVFSSAFGVPLPRGMLR